MKHQTKLTLTSTTPEHIGLKNRPRDFVLGQTLIFFKESILKIRPTVELDLDCVSSYLIQVETRS